MLSAPGRNLIRSVDTRGEIAFKAEYFVETDTGNYLQFALQDIYRKSSPLHRLPDGA